MGTAQSGDRGPVLHRDAAESGPRRAGPGRWTSRRRPQGQPAGSRRRRRRRLKLFDKLGKDGRDAWSVSQSAARDLRTQGFDFLEEARYQATNDEKGEKLADASWEKAGRYHVIGGLVTPWHPAGDAAQRVVDVITSKMLEDEQNRINADATSDHTKTYENRRFELQKLADIWYQENKEWAEDPTHEGFSKEHGVYAQIEGSANDGNKKAEGVAGIQ
ncbi:hypothetical protein [Streptomyces termitum]|uniref:hypothetical protein n=1 Tax=Streptomyces termitum TaxID=67368 RepID=UPI00339F0F3C